MWSGPWTWSAHSPPATPSTANWLEFTVLASGSFVELPGIEPVSLPGDLASELPVRSVSVRFSTTRYLRVRFRVLTASRVVTNARSSPPGQGYETKESAHKGIESVKTNASAAKVVDLTEREPAHN
jgi:hypothetical protein